MPDREQSLERVLSINTTRRSFISGAVSVLNRAISPFGFSIEGIAAQAVQQAAEDAFGKALNKKPPLEVDTALTQKLVATHQARLLVARAEGVLAGDPYGVFGIQACIPVARVGLSLGISPSTALDHLKGSSQYRPTFEAQALIHAAIGNLGEARAALSSKKDQNSWWSSRLEDFWTDYGVSLHKQGADIGPEVRRFHSHIKAHEKRYGGAVAVKDVFAVFHFAATGEYPKGYLESIQNPSLRIHPDSVATRLIPTGNFEGALHYFKKTKEGHTGRGIRDRVQLIDVQLQSGAWREALETSRYVLGAIEKVEKELRDQGHTSYWKAEVYGLMGRAISAVDKVSAEKAFDMAKKQVQSISTKNEWRHISRAEAFTLLGEQQFMAGVEGHEASFDRALEEYNAHMAIEAARRYNIHPSLPANYHEVAARQAKLGYRAVADQVMTCLSYTRPDSFAARFGGYDFAKAEKANKAPKAVGILVAQAEQLAAQRLTAPEIEVLGSMKDRLVDNPDPLIKQAALAIL